MKVLFLDFDGVLNSEKFVRNSSECGLIINRSKMLLLKEIIDKTNAKIVLSTSWREHWEKDAAKNDSIGIKINEIFGCYGLTVFDKTPKLHIEREKEIEAWLKVNPDITHFAVLDDRLLSAEFLSGHFVKTSNYFDGLNETDVIKAIEILNG